MPLIRSTFLVAIFLSVLLHFLVLGMFTFTVTRQSASYKPQIIFWGAFLQKQDILPYAFIPRSPRQDKTVQTFINNAVSVNAQTPFLGKSISKPYQADTITDPDKMVIKSFFPFSLDAKNPKESPVTVIQIPANPPDYKPLKLYPNDTH